MTLFRKLLHQLQLFSGYFIFTFSIYVIDTSTIIHHLAAQHEIKNDHP